MKVEEGFGDQINLCRDWGLYPGPQAKKSDTLPLDHQLRNLPRVEALSIMLRIEGNLTQASGSVGTAIVDQLLRLLKQKSNRSDGNWVALKPINTPAGVQTWLINELNNTTMLLQSMLKHKSPPSDSKEKFQTDHGPYLLKHMWCKYIWCSHQNSLSANSFSKLCYEPFSIIQHLNREGAKTPSLDNNPILENYHYGMGTSCNRLRTTNASRHCQYQTNSRGRGLLLATSIVPRSRKKKQDDMRELNEHWQQCSETKELLFGIRLKHGLFEHVQEDCYPLPLSHSFCSRTLRTHDFIHRPIQPAMGAKFGVFKEPRGVMRILQFIFSICAFATTTGFTSFVLLNIFCGPSESSEVGVNLEYSYPFRLDHVQQQKKCSTNVSDPEAFTLHTFHLVGDFSSDAQFFVATGVLSLIYSFLIGIVYVLFDAKYQSNELLPLTDFILTVTLSVFWLSGSAAWANGLTGLKGTTSSIISSKQCLDICKSAKVGSVSGLNISIMLGFLNFFLWASDLWFLYKETSWFKLKQGSSGMDSAA
uniref:(California timema) hypothetical protein n=1 Tax=Timema californicum TaxID=61474 RepID=A0A7R9J9V4_TIMCA|nr:unnamed protein product [Timema californicum]